jgi:hypothetical protein
MMNSKDSYETFQKKRAGTYEAQEEKEPEKEKEPEAKEKEPEKEEEPEAKEKEPEEKDQSEEGFKWPWSKEENEDGEEKENPIEQIKKYGIAGVISYALWEGGFWTAGGAVGLAGYYAAFGHWPDLSNPDDASKVGAEAFAFVNLARFAVPLRIGLAVGTAPWVEENIVERFIAGDKVDWGNFAEDFKVVDDELGIAANATTTQKFVSLVSKSPLNKGREMDIKKETSEGPDGEPILTMTWNADVYASDLDPESVEDMKLKERYSFPLQVAGSTISVLKDGKVASMKVGPWTINGEELPLPHLKDLSEEDGASIEKWAKGMATRDKELAA